LKGRGHTEWDSEAIALHPVLDAEMKHRSRGYPGRANAAREFLWQGYRVRLF